MNPTHIITQVAKGDGFYEDRARFIGVRIQVTKKKHWGGGWSYIEGIIPNRIKFPAGLYVFYSVRVRRIK